MNWYTKPRFWVVLGVGVIALLLGQQIWHWEVERIEVPPSKFLVRIHQWGTDLAEDEIIAPDKEHKGVMLEPLAEGRHFLNPLFWSYEMHPIVEVPSGQCLVLTRKYGREIPPDRILEGDILAHEGERGLLAETKGPGFHRINPHAFSWELVKAVDVGVSQVGVHLLQMGKDPRALPPNAQRSPYVLPKGYKGVQEEVIQKGTYYLNPYVETITPVETREHRAELYDIEFPSRDGFTLKPHVAVVYRVQAAKAPELLVRLSDQGILHQEDETPEQIKKNEILQKVVLPHIRGYARIEGSNFEARDFAIMNAADGAAKPDNPREKLQKALEDKVKPRCAQLGIDILSVKVTSLDPPEDLALVIGQRIHARVAQENNKSRASQYRSDQKVKSTETKSEMESKIVDAMTLQEKEKTQAETRLKVEELRLKQELQSAKLRLEAAKLQAKATLTIGQADADVIKAQNEAEVAGLQRAVKGFGSPGDYAQYQIVYRLAPSLQEIFTSDESEFARLFTGYMTPAAKSVKKSTPVVEMPRAH